MKPVIVIRRLFVIVFLFSISLITKSQNLTIEGAAPNLYITHVVAPKENFYSVSRLYNQAPKTIAAFNKITMEKGLTIGQQVKIPLNAQNFDASGNSHSGETLIPLTHIVAKGETLFRIGSSLNIPLQSIRKWNKLSADNISAGTPLVVGYLKSTSAQSSAKNNTITAANNAGSVVNNAETAEPKQTATETNKNETFSANSHKDQETQSEVKNQDNNQDEGKPKQQGADPSATIIGKDTAFTVVPENPKKPNSPAAPAKEEPLKPQETSTAKSDENKITEQKTVKTDNLPAGNFESLYSIQALQKSENTKSGEAATFKSTSGWQDKKYYVLINDIAPGTIIKITSSGTKAIYAKVLGSMPEMKENNGLLLRVSNAAASDLGIIDPRFSVQISYYQ